MAQALTVTQTRIRAGLWEGVVSGAAAGAGSPPPALEVSHQGRILPGLSLIALRDAPGSYAMRFAIPAEVLSEGVQTFLITEGGGAGAAVLAYFTIITGAAAEADLRAETDLLRAELDLLKRAFRQHCLETGAAG